MPNEPRYEDKPKITPSTSIVVPVLNEADNIMPLVKRVKSSSVGTATEIIFVDDSRDSSTARAIMQAKKTLRGDLFDIRTYRRKGKRRWGGLSGSVSDGFKMAQGNKIVVMDGDLQHPPETIPKMLATSMNHDIVIASRYCKGGSADGLENNLRHFISRGSIFLAKLFFPLRLRKITDPMTGFFLVDRQLIDTKLLRPKGFKILLEILLTHPKLSTKEVPIKFGERLAGDSHGGIKQGMEFFGQLFSLRTQQVTRTINSMPKFVQFGMVGGSVFLIGMILLYVLVDRFNWSPLAANAVQLAFTFWLNYELNKRVTWSERALSKKAAHKFFISRAATTVLNYYLFAWLISIQVSFSLLGTPVDLSVHYLVANVIALIVITALNFIVTDYWAFADRHAARKRVLPFGLLPLSTVVFSTLALAFYFGPIIALSSLLSLIGLTMLAQASLEVWRMIYAYRTPEAAERLAFPKPSSAQERFCLIVPARHESPVLADTLNQLAKQTHPDVRIVTVICDDDHDTLRVAHEVAAQNARVKVIEYPLLPGVKPSKPKQLNYALSQIDGQDFTVVGVIDAEDNIHPELLMHVDAAFRDQETGIVQGGVQLINHHSTWYSLHNVLEYYRWFNSTMSFQADNKFMPLGGNTVFIRHDLLTAAGGWPVTLTEDCSLGVLLSTRFKTKTAVHYEPRLATLEETPDTLKSFFKQRVRWNQGFFHEWRKNIWRELPSFGQRLLAGYVLLGPILFAAMSLIILMSLLGALLLDAPVGFVMLMYLPLIPIGLQIVMNIIFLHDFGRAFERKISLINYLTLVLTFLPYQFLLNAAAFWSVIRELKGDNSWDKTAHVGQHRLEPTFATVPAVQEVAELNTENGSAS